MKASFFFSVSRYDVEVFSEEAPSGKITKIILHKKLANPTSDGEQPESLKAKSVMSESMGMLAAFLRAYFEQKPLDWDFNWLAMERLSTFQKEVLKQCAAIPYGMVVSYKDLASILKRPQAARAVGQVMARNPFPIILPCHRVVRYDGNIGNYGYGTQEKRWLLEHEGVSVTENGFVERKAFIRHW